MTATGLIVALVIVLWGSFEYYRRERNHRRILSSLGDLAALPPRVRPRALWQILGSVLTALLLAVASILMLSGAGRAIAPSGVMFGMGLLFGSMMVLVVLIIIRDVRLLKGSAATAPREKP